jgi:hypothetical protein
MKTVLIITASFDPQADLLIAELRRRSVPCVRWNTYEFQLSSLLTYRRRIAALAPRSYRTGGPSISLRSAASGGSGTSPPDFPPDSIPPSGASPNAKPNSR